MSHFKQEAVLNLLFLVIPLISIIVYAGYQMFFDPIPKVRLTETKLSAIKMAMDTLARDIGRLITTEEGLRLLYENRGGLRDWKGPYIASSDLLKDGWGRPFIYQNTHGVTYVGSPGENGRFDSTLEDVKTRRKKGDDIFLVIR